MEDPDALGVLVRETDSVEEDMTESDLVVEMEFESDNTRDTLDVSESENE